MKTKWNESSIQSLKAQEAKDLAVDFLHKLQAKERAPITPGQVQLRELQYGLKIKEAEAEDNRCREAHHERLKELELQIEQERRQHAEADQNAQRVQQQHAQLVEQVRAAEESLTVQLERETRQYNVKVESLEANYAQRKETLNEERERLEEERAALVQTIQELTELHDTAHDVAQIREEIESQKANHQRELQRLDDEFDTAQFERTKKVSQIRRDQEVEIADLEMQHRKQVMQRNLEAAEKTFADNGLVAVAQAEWDEVQAQLKERREQDESQAAELRRATEFELKQAYNITTPDVFDVTELHYREKALAHETASLREQIAKLENEIGRMRQHVEREPDRISKAVEAAKVQISNNIEQATRGR